MPTKPVTMDNLVVVDFQKSSEVPELNHWKSLKLGSQVLCAEKCSRNIWLGAAEDFESFPELKYHPENEMLQGQEAYERILQFMLGIRNEGAYDPAAFNRFMDGWMKLNRRNPTGAQHMREVVNTLTADMAVIRAAMPKQPLSTRTWVIARELAGQKKGDSAFIIGNLDRSSVGPSFLTAKMATALNACGEDKINLLDVTHPQGMAESFKLSTGVNTLYTDKRITLSARALDMREPEELRLILDLADQVYVTIDMDEYPEQDEILLQAWASRSRDDNKLVHVKDSVQSAQCWGTAGVNGYISPSNIENELCGREIHNHAVYDFMRMAIQSCSAMRYKDSESPKAAAVAYRCALG